MHTLPFSTPNKAVLFQIPTQKTWSANPPTQISSKTIHSSECSRYFIHWKQPINLSVCIHRYHEYALGFFFLGGGLVGCFGFFVFPPQHKYISNREYEDQVVETNYMDDTKQKHGRTECLLHSNLSRFWSSKGVLLFKCKICTWSDAKQVLASRNLHSNQLMEIKYWEDTYEINLSRL